MNDNTAMPNITFSNDCDYDAIYSMMSALDIGLGGGPVFRWHLDSDQGPINGSVVGQYAGNPSDDKITIRLYQEGEHGGSEITIDFDYVTEIEYL